MIFPVLETDEVESAKGQLHIKENTASGRKKNSIAELSFEFDCIKSGSEVPLQKNYSTVKKEPVIGDEDCYTLNCSTK